MADVIADMLSDVPPEMGTIFLGMLAGLAAAAQLLTRRKDAAASTWLAGADQPGKQAYEHFAAWYSVVWMGAFGVIIAAQLYEQFTEVEYLGVLGGLALPLFLQPVLAPAQAERSLPFWKRYGFKANAWIWIYSFIGNYWYTHYFFSVLKANYTFPSWRLNYVPFCLYLATHFYFSSYHVLSNALLRKVATTYAAGPARWVFSALMVLCLSYATAFMETFTIAGFPYYTFENRSMAYTVGSAFYGIYFIYSFPMFFLLDERSYGPARTLYETVVDACGCGMLILTTLDLVRLALSIPLTIPGSLWELVH
uniref:Cycloeucalenol cycloisomerase n=1 Tax=Phaeomonas parva TaxID=124430 RepID=A0A6U4EXF3_9STRA